MKIVASTLLAAAVLITGAPAVEARECPVQPVHVIIPFSDFPARTLPHA